jgi:hypothetical protein
MYWYHRFFGIISDVFLTVHLVSTGRHFSNIHLTFQGRSSIYIGPRQFCSQVSESVMVRPIKICLMHYSVIKNKMLSI